MTTKTLRESPDTRDLRLLRRNLKVTSGEIADLAGKHQSAVTHWRKGKKGFPEPVVGGRSPLFRYDEVHDWLGHHGKLIHEPDAAWLWRKAVQALHESTGVSERSRLRGYVTAMVVVLPDFLRDIADFVELRETGGFDQWLDETDWDLDAEDDLVAFLREHLTGVAPDREMLGCAARTFRYAFDDGYKECRLLDEALNALDALSPVQTTTSLPVARLISELIGNLADHVGTVADLACGEAIILRELLEQNRMWEQPGARFVGVESDRDTAAIARIRLMLHDYWWGRRKWSIHVGNSLAVTHEPTERFDTVIVDPPTTKTKAWLDLAKKSLAINQASRAFVLLPSSALVANGPCASLIRERRLEAVVRLPNRLKTNSRGLALCVITSESTPCEEILLINLADLKVRNPYPGPVRLLLRRESHRLTPLSDPTGDALSVADAVTDVCAAISHWRNTRTVDRELFPGCQESIGAETAVLHDLKDWTDEGFVGKRAAEMAGITYRQLDYWASTDLVAPSLIRTTGDGSTRRYSYRDLLELRAVKSLLDAGIELDLVRKVFTYLDQLNMAVVETTLVIQGTSVMVRTGTEEVLELIRNGQGVLNILPLYRVIEGEGGDLVELSPEASDRPGETIWADDVA